jgi:hypothetical protein
VRANLWPERADGPGLKVALNPAGVPLGNHDEVAAGVDRLRATYEPHIRALAWRFGLSLPAWLPDEEAQPNWRLVAEQPGLSVSWHG